MEEIQSVGAFIGLAIGDAMGAPLEGLPPRSICRNGDVGGGIHDTIPGQYTDDTLQASSPRGDPHPLRKGLMPTTSPNACFRVYRVHPEFFGPTSGAVLDLIGGGEKPEVAAARAHEMRGAAGATGASCGGAASAYSTLLGRCGRQSLAASRVTHFDPAAGEASAVINRMVSGICRGEERG